MAFSRPLDIAEQMQAFNGSPQFAVTVAATTTPSINRPALVTAGCVVLLQPDAACYVLAGKVGAAVSITSANGLLLAAGEKYVLCLNPGEDAIQAVAVSTANLRIFVMN